MAGRIQLLSFNLFGTASRTLAFAQFVVHFMQKTTLGVSRSLALAFLLSAGILFCTGCGVTPTAAISAKAANSVLEVSPATLDFGAVNVGASSTKEVTLTSSGAASITVESAAADGSGFSVTGATFPLTLAGGQSKTLQVKFVPGASGNVAGTLTFSTGASAGAAVSIPLSGSGNAVTATATYAVDLSWQQPNDSSAPVLGYYIYRENGSATSYQLLNASLNTSLSYTDDSVQAGNTYKYYVTSVASSGLQSAPSNLITLTIP